MDRRFSGVRLAVAALTLAAAPAHAQWAPTATGVVQAPGAQLLGPAADTLPLHVIVGLKLRDEPGLDAFIAGITTVGSPLFGQKLTPADFLAGYAPALADAQLVADYLAANGFTKVQIAANRLQVSAYGTVAAASRAFNTAIDEYAIGNETAFANATPPLVPAALAGIVSAVAGLQSVAGPVPFTANATLPGGVLEPPQYPHVYDAQGTPAASGTTAAIMMNYGLDGVQADLRAMESRYGLSHVPVEYRVAAGLVDQTAINQDDSSDSEFAMDAQASRAIAGGFRKMLWYTSEISVCSGNDCVTRLALMTEAAADVNAWAADGEAQVASMSLAECESAAAADGVMIMMDASLKQAVAQGQTLFVSSGDSGNFCGYFATNGTNAGVPGVEYPGSSPYAVAVGGTTLAVSRSSGYAGETGWEQSGGGDSVLETAPAWQAGFATSPSGGKSVPDISMESIPGIAYFLDGSVSTGGGTSLAAPLAMGAWARIVSASGNTPGFAAPWFYALETRGKAANDYSPAITGFRDIVADDGGAFPPLVLYPAQAGYDRLTGIGSIDICRLAELTAPGKAFCGSSSKAGSDPAAAAGTLEIGSALGLLLAALARVMRALGRPRR